MTAALIAHAGARIVTRAELEVIDAPEPTATWYPVAHRDVVLAAVRTLGGAGFRVDRQQFAVARDNHRMFGTLDLETPLAPGVSLSVGIRNSTDKSFPMGFTGGSRVFVCDNLAFSGDVVVARKHTKHGREDYRQLIHAAVASLEQYAQAEAGRVLAMQATDIGDVQAESAILRAYERGILSARTLPAAIAEWREPTYDDFRDRTLWSLFNAVTFALGAAQRSNPQRHAALTMSLSTLLCPGAAEAQTAQAV